MSAAAPNVYLDGRGVVISFNISIKTEAGGILEHIVCQILRG